MNMQTAITNAMIISTAAVKKGRLAAYWIIGSVDT